MATFHSRRRMQQLAEQQQEPPLGDPLGLKKCRQRWLTTSGATHTHRCVKSIREPHTEHRCACGADHVVLQEKGGLIES